MDFLTSLYLFFIFVSLYVSFLFMILYFKNKDDIYRYELTNELPTLSVLIPAYNEEENIKQTIDCIKEADYPKELIEIIVINDGSKDKTLKILNGIDGIKILNKENSGKADSLNKALKIAKGEIIATIDADCFPERDAFLKMVSYFKEQKVGAVTASVFVKNKNNLLEKFQNIEYAMIAFGRRLLDYIDSVFVTSGALSMYRKSILIEVGGFDKNNLTEDIEIAWNILSRSYKVKMCFNAKALTIVPDKFGRWWRQRLRWDIGGLQCIQKYKKALFRKKYDVFGLFVVPFFSSYVLLSFISLILAFYLIVKNSIIEFSFFSSSILNKSDIFRWENLVDLTPTVFTFLWLFLIFIFLFFIIVQFRIINKEQKHINYNFITFLFLLIYPIFFPFLLVHSTYRLLIGKIQW